MLPVQNFGNINVVSVHDESEPIHFQIPSVTPSRYDIPGINAPKDLFTSCQFSFPNQKPIKYAVRRTISNHPYVLVKIVEPHTVIHGTEQQKLDEFGKPLAPDIQRIPVPVRMELVANEIERQCGQMGLAAHQGEVTLDLILQLEAKNIDFMRRTVADTNRLAKRSPANITSEARRRAWQLYKKGLLIPLPDWADVNPGADTEAKTMFNCLNCGKQLRKDVVKCDAPGCGVIYNWKKAVDMGLVKPADVPPSKRAEAGLVVGADDTRESTAPVPEREPVNDPNDDEEAYESLMHEVLPPVVALDPNEEEDQEEDQEESQEGNDDQPDSDERK